MRKAWSLALTPVVALAVSAALTTPARAFGAEVLGCDASGTWTASFCTTDGDGVGVPMTIEFAVHNLSGTYTYAWTTPTNGDCSTTSAPCIYRGCTSTASICDITVKGGPNTRSFPVSVKLTQSGKSRTISATATVYGSGL